MNISKELMIFAAVGAAFGWLIIPDSGGKFAVFTMAFICWIASRVCRCIELAAKAAEEEG